MEEVVVAAVDNEPLAELIAGRLRVEGIRVRIRYDSQVGIPRQLAPGPIGFGPGGFRIAVAAADAGRASDLIGDVEPVPHRKPILWRAVAALLLANILFGVALSVMQVVALLSGRL